MGVYVGRGKMVTPTVIEIRRHGTAPVAPSPQAGATRSLALQPPAMQRPTDRSIALRPSGPATAGLPHAA
jgi:hypothetical protein